MTTIYPVSVNIRPLPTVPDGIIVATMLPIPSNGDLLLYISSTELEHTCYISRLRTSNDSMGLEEIMDLSCTSTPTFVDLSADEEQLILGYSGIPATLIDLRDRTVTGQIDLAYGLEWKSIQWLDNSLAIGELYFKGYPVMVTTFMPHNNISIYSQQIPENVTQIIVPPVVSDSD